MYYGLVVMLIMMLLNIFIFPSLTTPGGGGAVAPSSRHGQGEISEVSKSDVQITFARQESEPAKLAKTGLMEDPELISRDDRGPG